MMDDRRKKKIRADGPFSALKRFSEKLFANRIFLFLFSIAAAVTIWCIMASSEGKLTRRKRFEGIQLTVSGESSLLTRGYVVTDDLTQVLPTVDMTVEVAQTNYDRASATSYNPHLELSNVSGEGEVEVPVTYSSQAYGKVASCMPSSVTLHVERYITRRVPVVITLTGDLPAGYFLGSTEKDKKGYDADPNTLVVSGPQSIVSTVTSAAVVLDQSALSPDRPSDRMALPFELRNSAGEAVVSDKVSVTYQSVAVRGVTVETSLVPTKRVPIETASLLTGEPAEGFEVVDIWPAEDSISIAASQEVLDSITSVPVDTPMDVTGLKTTTTGMVRLKTITSAVNSVPVQMSVTAVIREKQVERTFRNVSIIAEGVSEDRQVSLSHKKTTVQLKGSYTFINSLSAEDIMLYVDVSGIPAGTQKLPVQVRIDNASDFTCALNVTEVSVTVREK